jgi:hypothetical protein
MSINYEATGPLAAAQNAEGASKPTVADQQEQAQVPYHLQARRDLIKLNPNSVPLHTFDGLPEQPQVSLSEVDNGNMDTGLNEQQGSSAAPSNTVDSEQDQPLPYHLQARQNLK